MPDSASAAAVDASAQAELHRRLDDIRARHPAVDPAAVAEVVQSVLATMTGDLSAPEIRLLSEIEELGRTIARARAEVAALGVDDITDSHIPVASDELEAVVTHTANATDRILAVCETLDTLADGLTKRGGPSRADAATALGKATTEIYESCSFQDITGQRISKVVGALQAIDVKVARIMEAFGERRRGPQMRRADGREHKAPSPEALLRGPQLPGAGMDQSDIDQLLASF